MNYGNNTMDFDKNFPTFKKIYKRTNENIINSVYPQTILDYCFRILLFLILCRNFPRSFIEAKIYDSQLFNCIFSNIKINDSLIYFLLYAYLYYCSIHILP